MHHWRRRKWHVCSSASPTDGPKCCVDRAEAPSRRYGSHVYSKCCVLKLRPFAGHVNTYVDPESGQTYDYGVQVFSNISVLYNFFSHFDIPVVPLETSGGGVTKYVNFDTGAEVPTSDLIAGNITAAWLEYADQQAKYPSIFREWDLPHPVPEDLLMPFGNFIRKYDLKAMAYQAYQYDQGAGNILAQPTLYMMKYQDRAQMHDFLEGGFVRNNLSDNQELYNRAQAELEPNVFLSSNVESIVRKGDCAEVCVLTPSGQKYIKASKLLITIPPKLSNLGFLDLDSDDQGLLGQFNNSYYWDAVLQNTGIPDDVSVSNVNPDAAFNLPAMPGTIGISTTSIKGLHAAYYNSPKYISDAEVQAEMLATVDRVRSSLGYSTPKDKPVFAGFHNHSPFVLTVSTEAIKYGFYKKLLALQGKSNTWWTGATWMNQATATTWRYTEEHVLPGLLKSVKRSKVW